jgi:hypothetical protein
VPRQDEHIALTARPARRTIVAPGRAASFSPLRFAAGLTRFLACVGRDSRISYCGGL